MTLAPKDSTGKWWGGVPYSFQENGPRVFSRDGKDETKYLTEYTLPCKRSVVSGGGGGWVERKSDNRVE